MFDHEWDAHENELGEVRTVLRQRIRNAEPEVRKALEALGQLQTLYDVEIVEGPEGEDAHAHLTSAARELRAAGWIIDKIMAQDSPREVPA